MSDFRVDMAPDGPNVRFTLYKYAGGQFSPGTAFNPPALNLPAGIIDKMRRGEALPNEVQQVTGVVSQWLFGTGIGLVLTQELNAPGAEPLRLIISIDDARLRESLGDTPFELCMLQNAGIPLALHGGNASIFHLLPKVGTPPPSTSAGSWPLRILIVRSNPLDLGGAIPATDVLRKDIYQLLDAKGLSHSLVQIHILSSENAPNLAGRPTRENFRDQINNNPYDILLYLGHGDVLSIYDGLPPVSVLQLESDDGSVHVAVPADQLAVLFHERPVPVVLLIGCLTAAGVTAQQRAGLDPLIPQWMKGVQGLAQALVNSESGVQLAVGSRYLLETADAMQFLKAFFKSLLVTTPGNVEGAVRAARTAMSFFSPPGSYSWSAPVIFRDMRKEPIFQFLKTPPLNVCPNVDQLQSFRALFWENLSKQSWNLRPQGGADPTHDILKTVEGQYVQSVLGSVPALILPTFFEAQSGQVINIPIQLHGSLNVDELRGTLVIGGESIRITALQPTAELQASGYTLLAGTQGNQASFSIEKNGGAGGLVAGPLLNAVVQLDAASQVVYPINVNIQRTQPAHPVCTGVNAIVVPAS